MITDNATKEIIVSIVERGSFNIEGVAAFRPERGMNDRSLSGVETAGLLRGVTYPIYIS
jgi:hypothetical protein